MPTKRQIEIIAGLTRYGFSPVDIFELTKLNHRLANINLKYANDGVGYIRWTDEDEKKRGKVIVKILDIFSKYNYRTEISYSPIYCPIKFYRDAKDEIGFSWLV